MVSTKLRLKVVNAMMVSINAHQRSYVFINIQVVSVIDGQRLKTDKIVKKILIKIK